MVHTLEEFMVKRGGSVDPRKFKNEIFELLSIPAYDEGKPEILEGDKIGSAKKIVAPNDILLSKIVPHIRRCWIVPRRGEYRQIASGEWIQFRSDELVPEYLRYFLISDPFHSQFMKTVTGVGGSLLRANPAKVSEIKIPLPPLDDQKRIAHLLGKVEGLITRRKQHLQQLDDLLKSVFLEMFGDPISNPKGYPVRKLSEFYINPKEGAKCGPFGSALKKDEIVSSGVPVWNMDNIDLTGRMVMPFRMWITEEKYKELNSYSVIDGDIIISRAGTVGKMCIARMMDGEPAIISTNLIRLRLGNELRPLHVVSLMTYCKGRVGRLKTGPDGAFTHMNTGILDKLEFPYPPIDLQDQFAAVVEKVEDLKSRYQQSLTDLESLYGALSQKAFKGELDLSRVVVTMDKEEPAEEMEPISTDLTDTLPVIELPTPESVGSFFSAKGREALISQWLEIYLERLGSIPFSAQHFIETAQQRLVELLEELEEPESLTTDYNFFQFGPIEYDHVKELIFQALESGRLAQAYDEAGNRVLLTMAKG